MKSEKLKNLRSEVRANLIKSELLNFRMAPDSIQLIYEIADKKQVNISTLLRDWVNEKIEQELMSSQAVQKHSSQAVGETGVSPMDYDVNVLRALCSVSERLGMLEQAMHELKELSTQPSRPSTNKRVT